jgi:hypothetical protein
MVRLARSTPLPPGVSFDEILWCSGGEEAFILFNRSRDPLPGPGLFAEVPNLLVRSRATRADTIATTGVTDVYVAKYLAAASAVPNGRATLAAVSRDLLFLCSNMDGRCEVFDTTGSRRDRFALALRRHRVTRAAWASTIAEYADREPDLGARRVLAQLLQELARPEEFPLVDQVRGDAVGYLWARTFDNYATGVATWLVVSQTGVPVAMVATPRSLRVLEIGEDYLLGVTRDNDGVERISLRSFRRFLP